MSLSKLAAPAPTEKLGPGGLNPEFTFSNAAGKFRWQACTKTPGHEPFIPIKEFTKDKLPRQYQHDIVVDSIRTMSELAVKVVTSYTSQDRPEGDSSYAMRGKRFGRSGSGFVSYVKRNDSRDLDLCACSECQRLPRKQNVVASVFVKTANHLVFDDSEAKATVAELFYDDEDNRDSIRRLFGLKVFRRDPTDDWCEFECLTHDAELVDKLLETLRRHQDLNKQTEKLVFDPPLAVVASHPHGRSKQISIGIVKRLDGQEPSTHLKPIKLSEPFSEVTVEGDKVIIKYNFDRPSEMVNNHPSFKNEETESTGIEVQVLFPDTTRQTCLIWQLDRPVVETKHWLLQTGGISDPPAHTLDMEIVLPDDDTQLMDDDKNINYYWDDLCRAEQIQFKDKINTPKAKAVTVCEKSGCLKKKDHNNFLNDTPGPGMMAFT